MSDLSAWHTALAAVNTAQARVLWIGDSILEGTGASTRAKRSQDLMLAAMAATHPVAGQGISQYLPQHYAIPTNSGATNTPWAPDWTTSQSGTITDENSGSTCYGPGMRSGVFATGAIATYTVQGTDIDIWTNASGTFQYAIDGGAYSSTINTSGQNAYADTTQVSLGASGSHTVSIKCISGPLNFLGLMVYDGGRSKGIAAYDYCHFGGTVPNFYASGATQINATFNRNLALINPHLVCLFIGANDTQVYTIAQFTTNFQNMINAIQTALPSASIMMCAVYNQQALPTVEGGGGTYAQYSDAFLGLAYTNSLPILHLPDYMPNVYTDTAGYYQADGEHLTDLGHALMAQAIGGYIDPLQAEPPAIVNYGAVASTTSATSTGVNTRTSGSSIIAVTTGAVASASSLTLADNKGNTYSKVTTLDYGGAYSTALWKCENAAGGAGHTFTQGGGGSRQSMSVMEVINAPASGFIRAFNGTTTLGAGPWNSGNVTGVAGDLILGVMAYDYPSNPTTASAGSGATLDTESTTATFMHTAIQHETLATSGTTSATMSTVETGGGAFLFVAAVKPANALNLPLTGNTASFGAGVVAVASAGVTVALTGQAVTSAKGAATPGISHALTGKATTSGHGAAKAAFLPALAGQLATSGHGALAAAPSVAVAGTTTTAGAGSALAALQTGITGQMVASGLGTITALSGGIAIALSGLAETSGHGVLGASIGGAVTGASSTVAQGALQMALSRAVTGEVVAVSQGVTSVSASPSIIGEAIAAAGGVVSAVPEVRVSLSGRSISAVIGTLLPAFTAPVTSQDATYAKGTLTAVGGHDVSVGITGKAVGSGAGSMAASSGAGVAGHGASVTQGEPVATLVAALPGHAGTFVAGVLTATAGHNVTVALTGFGLLASHGDLAASASVRPLGGQANASTGEMAASSGKTIQGLSSIFLPGSVTVGAALLIAGPGRVATFPADLRIAQVASDQRIALYYN